MLNYAFTYNNTSDTDEVVDLAKAQASTANLTAFADKVREHMTLMTSMYPMTEIETRVVLYSSTSKIVLALETKDGTSRSDKIYFSVQLENGHGSNTVSVVVKLELNARANKIADSIKESLSTSYKHNSWSHYDAASYDVSNLDKFADDIVTIANSKSHLFKRNSSNATSKHIAAEENKLNLEIETMTIPTTIATALNEYFEEGATRPAIESNISRDGTRLTYTTAIDGCIEIAVECKKRFDCIKYKADFRGRNRSNSQFMNENTYDMNCMLRNCIREKMRKDACGFSIDDEVNEENLSTIITLAAKYAKHIISSYAKLGQTLASV